MNRATPTRKPVDIKGWNVYVVDAHSLIFQVFHALPEMTSPRGEQVGAVFGFVRDMLYLIEEKKPNALDLRVRPARARRFATSCSTPTKPTAAKCRTSSSARFPRSSACSKPWRFPSSPARATRPTTCWPRSPASATKRGANCFIVTGDKDCRQLITDRVAVYNIRKNQVFDAAALREDWGIAPDQVVDFQALVGDKVDNVPGVPGIGPKTAQQLLETYGTLDNLLEHAAEVPGAKGKKLVECREQALLSRQLVRLDTHVPIAPDWDASRVGGIDHEALAELFAEFGFRSFADRVAKLAASDGRPPTSTAADANYQLVDTPAKLAELGRRAGQAVADQRRHRNDARLAALRRDRRLLIRLQAGRGVLRSRPRPGRRPRARSRRKRSTPCGPCSKTRPSARSART